MAKVVSFCVWAILLSQSKCLDLGGVAESYLRNGGNEKQNEQLIIEEEEPNVGEGHSLSEYHRKLGAKNYADSQILVDCKAYTTGGDGWLSHEAEIGTRIRLESRNVVYRPWEVLYGDNYPPRSYLVTSSYSMTPTCDDVEENEVFNPPEVLENASGLKDIPHEEDIVSVDVIIWEDDAVCSDGYDASEDDWIGKLEFEFDTLGWQGRKYVDKDDFKIGCDLYKYVNRFKNKGHQGYCMDLNAGQAVEGGKIQAWSCNGSNAQKWIYRHGKIYLGADLSKVIVLDGSAVLYRKLVLGSEYKQYAMNEPSDPNDSLMEYYNSDRNKKAMEQSWRILSDGRIQNWRYTQFCIGVANSGDGNIANGDRLELHYCHWSTTSNAGKAMRWIMDVV